MSAGALYPQILFFRSTSTVPQSAACRQREVCVGCTFHNHHIPSACIPLHLSVPAALLVFLMFQNTCSHTYIYIYKYKLYPFLTFYTNANMLFVHLKSVRMLQAPFLSLCLGLTRVVLGWLLGHCLTASTVSHATAPVPAGLPGPASPEDRGRRAKPKATSLLSKQTWSSSNSRLS